MPVRSGLLLVLLASIAAVIGCTRVVSLRYEPPGTVEAEPRTGLVRVERFRDARRNGRHELGRIRGFFGNALKFVETEEPVAAEVTRVFEEALAARGLLATGSGSIVLRGELRKLDCNHYHEREAHAELALELRDSSGRVLLQRVYQNEHRGGGGFTSGVFASRRKLAALAERTLAGAIDAALSDPGFVLAATATPGAGGTAAAPLPGGAPGEPGATPAREREAQLRDLEAAHAQGLLSDEEFARRRANLLGAL